MPGKLGVLILHGIGSQKPSYADGMMKKLKARLRKLKFNPDDVYWEPAYVADILEAKERRLWDRLSANNRMDYKPIRKFFIHNFGDAVAYQRLSTAGIDVYEKAHNRIHKHLKKLRAALRWMLPEAGPSGPKPRLQ